MSESFRHGRLPLGEVGRRFRARYRRWWHPQLANPIQKLRWRAHRFKELTPPRHVTDPDDSWRCCDDWQRILAKKLNSRIFAERAGVGVPKLLASGRHVSRIPFESLPRRFVLKPCFGGDCHGVYVMVDGREAFRQIDLTPRDLGRRLAAERWSHLGNPLLVEELIQDHRDDGPLPTEYNCFMFGSRIAAIRVLRRRVGTARTVNRFYSPEWEAFEHNLFGKHGRDARCDAPARLDELLRCAAKIGRLYEIAVRLDFYMPKRGPVFGELAPYPCLGAHFGPFGQSYLGEMWKEELPDDWAREGRYADRLGIRAQDLA